MLSRCCALGAGISMHVAIIPGSIVVGAIATPVFLFKSIWHKGAVEYHAFRAGYKVNASDLTFSYIDPTDAKALKHANKQINQKLKLLDSNKRTKIAALWILPFGVYYADFNMHLFSIRTRVR